MAGNAVGQMGMSSRSEISTHRAGHQEGASSGVGPVYDVYNEEGVKRDPYLMDDIVMPYKNSVVASIIWQRYLGYPQLLCAR